MNPTEITAVVVTRGDRDISVVIKSLSHFGEIVVWDNSYANGQRDMKVYGRFAGAAIAKHDVIYIQDDDCVIDSRKLVSAWSPGEVLVNMPVDRRAEYAGTGIVLIGWGCVFERWTLDRFNRYLSRYPNDELFKRECDRVFTYLNRDRVRLTAVEMRQLPYAFGNDRMGREPRHRNDFLEVRRRLESIESIRQSA